MFFKPHIGSGVLAIILSGGLLSCGPSPEELAATAAVLTAAAATSTPTITPTFTPTPTNTPTPTPTPIPYDLSVLVRGEEDAPILGATVVLAEIGDESGTQATDDVGQAFWYDLPGETINLSISAPGYFPRQRTDSIHRGINQLTVALDRDPHGLLPSEACAPGERLLYLEDFQDGEAQGWQEIEFRTQGWDLAPHPDSPGDRVVLRPGEQGRSEARLHDIFDNAVWRVRFMLHGRVGIELRWQGSGGYVVDGADVEYSAYALGFSPPFEMIVSRSQYPLSEFAIFNIARTMKRDVWHTVEISTYEGLLGIWIDGNRLMTYQDPKPLPGGSLSVEVYDSTDAESVAYVNDISVCELTAPFVPMPTPES